MAHSDKNILITPNRGQSADPKIEFVAASATLGPQTITLQVYPTDNGTLSWEGSAGQLFSLTNSMTGTIYSVNDVSGIPSIEVLDTGLVKLAQYSGNVLLGTGTDNGTDKLQVNGSVLGTTLKGSTLVSTVATGTAPLTVTSTTRVANLNVATAGTADQLTTARNINGVSFNGSADITIADSTKLPLAGGTMTGAISFAAGQTWPTFNQNTTGSAATLTTARNINGTSFNGSSSILTVSWGTARTITIGATGKSVNGSANVSWTLAEIGATNFGRSLVFAR